MCMCEKPTINGDPGYSWDGKSFFVRTPDPPELADDEELLYDEPGRCGGIDSHCHHFRLVKKHGRFNLLVRNGGGDRRISLGSRQPGMQALSKLDSNDRYWLLQMLYHSIQDSARSATESESAKWRRAAAEKRIKTRKVRGKDSVKVWIEDGHK